MGDLPGGTVTFLLTDVEGSTRRWAENPLAMSTALAELDAVVEKRVSAHGGFLVKERGEGDSHFCVFARASDAVAAAYDIQLAGSGSDALPLRVAVHTGEALLRDADYYGATVNRAARLRAIAHPRQILVSGASADLAAAALPEGTALVPLGVHRLKDLDEPERILQLTGPGLPEQFPPLVSVETAIRNLPRQPTSFVGRGAEVAQIVRMLSSAWLVTITGPGGTGKTRLALEAAAAALDSEAPAGDAGTYDGVWFINLAALTDDRSVGDAVRATLRAPLNRGMGVDEAIAQYLGPMKALLVVDNCEHVITGVRRLLDRLIDDAPNLTVLATSRSPLSVRGEVVHRLAGMPVGDTPGEDAVALFTERARAVAPSFSIESEREAVEALCRRLEGSPLAIELAAARMAILSAQEILDRLGQRLDLLSRVEGAGPARHQSVHAAVEWSYDLLGVPEQTVFRRVSIFTGSFTLSAAESVCSTPPVSADRVLDAMAGLVANSLMVTTRAGSVTRYRMTEATRGYARERLRESGEESVTAAAHRAWCREVAREAAAHLRGPALPDWLDALDTEIDDLRLAMDTGVRDGDPATATQIATALLEYWMVRGNWKEGQSWLEKGLAAASQSDSALRLAALDASAELADLVSDYGLAERRATEMLTMARAEGDRGSEGLALLRLAHTYGRRGNEAGARPLLERAVKLLRDSGDPQSLRRALAAQANLTDSLPAARRLLEEAIELARGEGDPQTVAAYLLNLGATCQRIGEIAAARSAFNEALTIAEGLHYGRYIARSLMCLGEVALGEADSVGARPLLERAAGLWPEVGHLNGVAESVFNLGELARAEGDMAAAESLIRQALASYQRLDMGRHQGEAKRSLAAIRRVTGELPRARELALEALEMATSVPDRAGVARALETLGGVMIDEGAAIEAARLFGAAATVRDQIGQAPTAAEAAVLEADASAGYALAASGWDTALESGRLVRLDDVLVSLGVTGVTGDQADGPPVRFSETGVVRGLFRADGSQVTVAFGGPPFSVPATKGTEHIAALLRRPGEEVHVLALAGLGASDQSSGPMIDDMAKNRYRLRLEDLREESAEAEAFNDPERAARAEAEIEALARELSRAIGLGGRPRAAGSGVERARLNVTRAIRSAIRRMETHDPRLGHYLNSCIRTGAYCSYTPDPVTPVTWSLGED